MKSINMIVFSDEEFYNVRKVADTFYDWLRSQDKDKVEEWMTNLINEMYDPAICPNAKGWVTFFFDVMSRVSVKMTLEED